MILAGPGDAAARCHFEATAPGGGAWRAPRRANVLSLPASGAGVGLAGCSTSAKPPGTHWPPAADRAPHRDCIIEAGAALVWEGQGPVVKHKVSVRVRDDRIVEVSTEPLCAANTRRIDVRGHLLLPGFISATRMPCRRSRRRT